MPKTIKFLIATHETHIHNQEEAREEKKNVFDYVISVNTLNRNILKMLQFHIFQHQLTIISQLGRHISNNKLLPSSSTSMVICVTETKQKFFSFSEFSASYFGNSVSCVLTTKHFIINFVYITTTHRCIQSTLHTHSQCLCSLLSCPDLCISDFIYSF